MARSLTVGIGDDSPPWEARDLPLRIEFPILPVTIVSLNTNVCVFPVHTINEVDVMAIQGHQGSHDEVQDGAEDGTKDDWGWVNLLVTHFRSQQ